MADLIMRLVGNESEPGSSAETEALAGATLIADLILEIRLIRRILTKVFS